MVTAPMRRNLTRSSLMTLWLGLCLALPSPASAARFDSSWDKDGVVFTGLGESLASPANGIARDAKGRIIVTGGNESLVVARYLPNGKLDRSFSQDGRAFISNWKAFGPTRSVVGTSVAVQGNGRIVAAGVWHEASSSRFALECLAIARLLPNGSPDPSFGGKDGSADGRMVDCGAIRGQVSSVALQRGGNILVGGYQTVGEGPEQRTLGKLVRYTRVGALDRRFGKRGNGVVDFFRFLGDESSGVSDVIVLPSGRIVVSGFFDFKFMLARLLGNGRPDMTFAHKGRALLAVNRNCGGCAIGYGVARDRRGRLVLTGYVQRPGKRYVATARYLGRGVLDRSFGHEGVVRTKIGGPVIGRHIAIQHDGKLVVVGESRVGGRRRFAVFRYLRNGCLDRSFFQDGILIRSLHRPKSGASDVVIDEKGRLLISGGAGSGTIRFLIARLLP